MFYLILLTAFIFFTTISLYLLTVLGKKTDPSVKRFRNVEDLLEKMSASEDINRYTIKRKKSDQKLQKFSSQILKLIKKDEKKRSRLQKLLLYAGYRQREHLQNYVSLKVFLAFIFFVSVFLIGILYNINANFVLFFGLIAAFIGYIIPNIFLFLKIQNRQEKIASGLADTLDFLVVCVEAGMGLNSAIVRVGKEIQLKCKPLSDELLQVNQEIRTGLSREEALRNLGKRNRVQDLKVLVGSIILSDRLGTHIGDMLRAQSDSLRVRIRQRAEEQAAKAGIKLLFPLVIFILPALFLIILGPGVITFINAVLPLFQK